MSDAAHRPLDRSSQLMRDIVTWDVRTWSTAVLFWESVLPTGRKLRCLELGAGPGGPSLWLALQGHEVLCTNWQNTEEQARPLHERYGVSGIEYSDVDATRIPFENEFDLIVFKSVLGGVGTKADQDAAMRGIHRALKPGGTLIFAENLRATIFHRLARAIAYKVRGTSWRYVTIKELRPHLERYASHEVHATGFLSLFGPGERARNALAAADEAVFNRVVRESWHYVSYGTATK
ncbi:MAG: class I SAM-dependent methyltransferase [Actinobacteria bacterium]|nr:class I SAM-dependent methyltransferase [Actinomycetota bacterium]